MITMYKNRFCGPYYYLNLGLEKIFKNEMKYSKQNQKKKQFYFNLKKNNCHIIRNQIFIFFTFNVIFWSLLL